MEMNQHSIIVAVFVFPTIFCSVAWSQGTATGISRSFNPAISVNGLFAAAYVSNDEEETNVEHEHEHGPGSATGMQFQEAELQLAAFVDAYLKADLILTLPGGEGIEIEEGFVTTLGLPYNLDLKVGKFYANLGRQNLLHAHNFPFVDAPLINTDLFGGEGLNEVGIGLSWLAPIPWYTELGAQILNGDNQVFASEDGENLAYLGHLRNFWEITGDSTFELGGSLATGSNHHDDRSTIYAADLTFKWRPSDGRRSRSVVLQSEYIYSRIGEGDGIHELGGLYAQLRYQFARRWWAQGRYGRVGLPSGEEEKESRVGVLCAYVPSEFSSVRLQYNLGAHEGERYGELFLQLNFTIGSHPAHRY